MTLWFKHADPNPLGELRRSPDHSRNMGPTSKVRGGRGEGMGGRKGSGREGEGN